MKADSQSRGPPGLCRGTKWPEVQGGVPVLQGADGRGGVSGTSEALAAPPQPHHHHHNPWGTQAGQAAGGLCPCPLTLFHLLCFHMEPPSSQLRGLPLIPLELPLSLLIPPTASVVIIFLDYLFFNPCDSFVLVSVLAVHAGNFTSSGSFAEGNKRVTFNVSPAPFFLLLNDRGIYALGITGWQF